MKSNRLSVLVVVIGLVLAAVPMFGHHNGGAVYDMEQSLTFAGTVTKYDFINPHIRIYFDVKGEDGTVTNWVAESAPPQRVYRTGWNKNSLKPGDPITVTGHPSREGKKWMSVEKLVTTDGRKLSAGAD